MGLLTNEGYIRKRLSDYLALFRDGYKAIFGNNIDLSNDSPDGQIIGIVSEQLSDLDQAGEDVYNAFDPNSSSGISLSKLVLLNGIQRKPATNSTAGVTLVGLVGVTVPAGSIIKTSDTDTEFSLDAQVVLTGGSDAGTVTAVDTGSSSALAGTLTVISTPIAGWTSVTNSLDATIGQDEETDEELRLRRTKSTASSAKSIVDGIFGSLSELADVTGVKVLENDTASDIDSKVTIDFPADFVASNTIDLDVNGVPISQVTYAASHVNTVSLLDAAILAAADVASVNSSITSPGSEFEVFGTSGDTIIIDNIVVANGASQTTHTVVTNFAPILAHGIHAIVDGGDNAEIASTIFATRSAGSQMTGKESEIVVDDQGQNRTIKFSRPSDVDIVIEVDVTTDPSEFPGDGDQLIKDALVSFGSDNLNIGDDVILSRLYTPINSIAGHSVTSLQISKFGEALGSADIVIAINEIAKILDANITVNVT